MECLSLYNVDGSMRKTVKSKLLELFKLDPVSEKPRDYISLVDMGLIWRLATPTTEDRESRKRDGLEYHWGDYLDKIYSMIFSRHAMHTLSSLSMIYMTFPSASRMMSTIVGQQNIQKPQMFSPSPKTSSQLQRSSTKSWLIPKTRSDYRNL